MKQWATKSTDSKRVKLLKNCAAHLNSELLSSANQPIKAVEEMRNQLKAGDIARLNARIKLAEGNQAKEKQIEMNFEKPKRSRKVRSGKMYLKVT